MKDIVTFEDCRNKLDNVSTVDDLKDILKVFGRINEGEYYEYITIDNWTIGMSDSSIYILDKKELVEHNQIINGKINKITVIYILDEILKLNTDEFYRYYFKKYGYESLLVEAKSTIVKNILTQFINSKAIMKNIFTSEDYSSVTISGTKRNGTDYEFNTIGCSKEDVKELISLVRITPHINKKSISDYDRPYKPYYGTSDSVIKNAYAEYKEYLNCDEEQFRSIKVEDEYIKDDEDENEDYWDEEQFHSIKVEDENEDYLDEE